MRHLSILAAAILFSLFAFAQNSNVKQVKNDMSNQPYKVGATNVSIGNNAYAQKILWAWKYYDDNTLDKAADLLADDVVATFPDGSMVKGKDNFMNGIKDVRNSIASSVSSVDACVTLKSPDMKDIQVVTIWGTETNTNKDGSISKVHLNEVWFFNKEGKVVEFHQMAAKDAPEQK